MSTSLEVTGVSDGAVIGTITRNDDGTYEFSSPGLRDFFEGKVDAYQMPEDEIFDALSQGWANQAIQIAPLAGRGMP